jgi:hypothetical protein
MTVNGAYQPFAINRHLRARREREQGRVFSGREALGYKLVYQIGAPLACNSHH